MLLGMSLFHCNYTPRHTSFEQLFLYVVRTPAPEYNLRSPISLSRIPLKAPTQHESEAAEALLSLFSSRLESLVQPNESYNMDVMSEVQAPTPNDLGISAAPLSPLPLSQDKFSNASGCDDYGPIEQDIDTGAHVPRIRKERTSKVDTMLVALENLRKARISVMDLLLAILGGDFSEFYSHRLAFLCDSERIREILDIIWEEKKSRPSMESWVQDSGVDHICKLVSNEMESAKPLLKMKLKTVSPAYVEQWDVAAIMDPVAMITPTWTKILYAASEPQRSESEDTRNRPTV